MQTRSMKPPAKEHLRALRRLIPNLPNRQLESLRRGLIDLLTDVTSEKTSRQPDTRLVQS